MIRLCLPFGVSPVFIPAGEPQFNGSVENFTQHVHPRRGLRLQKVLAGFAVPAGKLPLATGWVIFLRRVSAAGTVTVLSQAFRVGKRQRGLHLRLLVDTGRVADRLPQWPPAEALARQTTERLADL